MMIWKLAKTLWVGALTSMVLFHANADEIDDAFKAGRTAEITRTEEQKQAARRALENARRRIQAEASAQETQPEEMEPENLLGEINALENLKAKLKQELESLREPEPAPAPAPAPAPKVAPAPRPAPVVVKPEPVPAPVVKPAPRPVVASSPDLNAFKGDINRQISQWREQDLKKQVEQRAALSRQQKELQKSFEAMLQDLRSDMAKARSADSKQVKSLLSQYQEQKAALAKQQKALDAQQAALDASRKSIAGEVASQTAALQKQGQDAIKKDMESLLAKVDERLLALKAGDPDPAGLSAEIEKAVNRATAGITKDLEKQFASLQASVTELKSAKPAPVDTAALEKKLRTDFKKDVAVLREGLTKAQVEIKKAQATDPLTKDVAALKEGLADTRSQLQEIQGLAAISQDDQAALVKYRKSLKDDIQALRAELRDELQSEIGTLAKAIEEEKEARSAAMAQQSEQMASLEKSLSKQIAESLGTSRPSAETEAAVAALRKENNALREDWKNLQKSLEGRMAKLEKPAPASTGSSADISKELASFKGSIDESLAQFKKAEAAARAQDLKKIEFTLNQYIKDIDQRLASLDSAPVEVAAVLPAPVVVDKPEQVVEVEPEPAIEPVQAEAPAREPVVLSEDAQKQRTQLEELRERLRKSLLEYKAEADAGRRAQQKALRQSRLDEHAGRKEALRQKIGANPEAAGIGDRLQEEAVVVQEEVLEEKVSSEPILIKDEGSEKKGLFSWLRRSSKAEAETESAEIEEAAPVEPAPVAPAPAAVIEEVEPVSPAPEPKPGPTPAEKVKKAQAAEPAPEVVVDVKQEAAAETAETEKLAAALRSELAKFEKAESAEPAVEEKPEKKGLFGWLRRSSKAEEEGVKAEEASDETSEEAPEETVGEPKEVNGDKAAPLRNGGEGETVRGLRGVIDTQMAAIGGELDQHPVFDLEEVEVAPAQGPRAEAQAEGGWKYEGAWARGRMNGPGKLTYPDGRVYTGQWKKGVRQGRGELIHPDGWTFSGEWGEGLINGEGSLTYTDGWAYSGSWKNGKMHGAGVLKHPDGWTYTGDWKGGRMNGLGALSFGDGWTYEGSWKNGKRSGTGNLTHPDGWLYAGSWRDGKRSGKGKLTFSDGWTYDGDWNNGTMNGAGTLQHPDGWAYEGEWKNGEMAGDGKIIIQN